MRLACNQFYLEILNPEGELYSEDGRYIQLKKSEEPRLRIHNQSNGNAVACVNAYQYLGHIIEVPEGSYVDLELQLDLQEVLRMKSELGVDFSAQNWGQVSVRFLDPDAFNSDMGGQLVRNFGAAVEIYAHITMNTSVIGQNGNPVAPDAQSFAPA